MPLLAVLEADAWFTLIVDRTIAGLVDLPGGR